MSAAFPTAASRPRRPIPTAEPQGQDSPAALAVHNRPADAEGQEPPDTMLSRMSRTVSEFLPSLKQLALCGVDQR